MSVAFAEKTMTLGQLREALAELDHMPDDTPVCATSNYGDYNNTMQAIPFKTVGEAYLVDAAGYSCSGWALKPNQYVHDDDGFNYNDLDYLEEEEKAPRKAVICLNANFLNYV